VRLTETYIGEIQEPFTATFPPVDMAPGDLGTYRIRVEPLGEVVATLEIRRAGLLRRLRCWLRYRVAA
jgi:DTW domain-containing protein YfiP